MSKISRSLNELQRLCERVDAAQRRAASWDHDDCIHRWQPRVEWRTIGITRQRYYYLLDYLNSMFKLSQYQCTDEYYDLTVPQLANRGVPLPPDVPVVSANYRISTDHETMEVSHRVKLIYSREHDTTFDVVKPELSVTIASAALDITGVPVVTRTKTVHHYRHPLMELLCIMVDTTVNDVVSSSYVIKVRTVDSDIIAMMSFLSDSHLETVYEWLCASPLPYTASQAAEVLTMTQLPIMYPTMIDLVQYAAITDGYVSLKADGKRMRMVITQHGLYLVPIASGIDVVMRVCAVSASSPRQMGNLYDGQQYSLFHGTVCDVEWLGDSILVLDVLRYATTDEPSYHPYPDDLEARLSLVDALVPYFPITIRRSHLFPIAIGSKTEAVSLAIAAMKQCYYPVDGLVFRSVDGSTAYKYKAVPSVDLAVSGGHLTILQQTIPWRSDTPLTAYYLTIIPPTVRPLTNDAIAEFDIHGSQWRFKRWRYDKSVPNHDDDVRRYIDLSLRYHDSDVSELSYYQLLSDEVLHAIVSDDIVTRAPDAVLVTPWMSGLVSLLAPPATIAPLPSAPPGDSEVAVATLPLTAASLAMCRDLVQEYRQLYVITYDTDAISAMVRYAKSFELMDGHTISTDSTGGIVIDGVLKPWYSVNQLIKELSELATVTERWYYGTLPITLGITLDGQVKSRMLAGILFQAK